MLVRAAKPKDINVLVALMRDTHAESATANLPFDEDRLRGVLDRILSDKYEREQIFVCEAASGAIIGYIKCFMSDYFYNWQKRANHQVLYVVPSARGSKAAFLLLKEYATWGVLNGAICIGLSMASDAPHKIDNFDKLAKHLGFVEEGRYYRKDVASV